MSLVDADGQPFTLSLPQLITRCQEETTRFFKTQRQIVAFFESFAALRKARCGLPSTNNINRLYCIGCSNSVTHCDEDADALVNVTFAKFSSAVPAEKIQLISDRLLTILQAPVWAV
jgi:hypothetical protein